ncbi:MAG: ATP-binding protein [Acidimicrobiales bacterium]
MTSDMVVDNRSLKAPGEREAWAEEAARAFLEFSPDAVVIIAASGMIILVNAQTESMFGYSRAELVGQPVEILIPKRLRNVHALQRDRYAARPRVRPMEAGLDLLGRRKDGTEFPVDISLAPVETARGRLVAASVRDITDRKRLEKVGDQFIYHAAHELRTPLATLAALGETLAVRMNEMSSEDVSDALGALRRQGQRASTLIDNLLDLSQLDGGHADVKLVPVDLGKAMSRVIEAAPPPEGKTVYSELEHVIVLADQLQLERLLTNLLTNAYRYGGSQIRVNAVPADGDVEVDVSDDGDGVAAELKDTVFDPFVRGKLAREVGGSGIGLALCQRIVESMGGTIWYDESGRGASFKFRLREHR